MTFLGENGCFPPYNPNNSQQYSQYIYYDIDRSNERKIEFDLQKASCCWLRDYAQMLNQLNSKDINFREKQLNLFLSSSSLRLRECERALQKDIKNAKKIHNKRAAAETVKKAPISTLESSLTQFTRAFHITLYSQVKAAHRKTEIRRAVAIKSEAEDQTENPDDMEEEGIVFIAFLFVLNGAVRKLKIISITDDSGFKCYNCSSFSQPDCDELTWGQSKYLHACYANSCSLVEMEHPFKLGVAIRVRRCGVFMTCDHVEYPVCCRCETDGCNGGNICSRAHYPLMETIEKSVFCLLLTTIISVCHCYLKRELQVIRDDS
uniref:Uncharacterized protein n=1 Tax=Glossina pallidipes TaxID=7398 RepID=A0A1B0A3L2_GLOPL